MHGPRFIPAGLLAATLVAACGDGTGPGNQAQVTVRAGIASGPAAAATIEAGPNTIVVEEVQLVLRKVLLKRESSEGGCEGEEDTSSCEVLRLGPMLVDLALDGSTEQLFTVEAEPGTYRRLQFQLHKPTGSADQAFLAANPGFAGVSVRVVGTFDGAPFTYTTDLTVTEHADLVPPLVLAESGAVDLTLRVNLAGWFANQAGTGLINPGNLGQGGELDSRIRQNIRKSFQAEYDD